jgi:hypothetical protein
MRATVVRLTGLAVLAAVVATGGGCRDKYAGATELHARQAVLRREVEGLREIVSRLERHEPMMRLADAAVAIDDHLVRDIIAAQLPLELDVKGYHVRLATADVAFSGHAVVRLRGTLAAPQRPGISAQVDVIGALDHLAVDQKGSTLSARIAIDHFGIEKAAGLESFLSDSSLSELGRSIRLQIADNLPQVQIPIRVQQTIDLPAVTRGAVRIDGASMPLRVSVSQVTAVQGRLWIGLRFEAGEITKTADAPAVADTSAAETGFRLDADKSGVTSPGPARVPGRGP